MGNAIQAGKAIHSQSAKGIDKKPQKNLVLNCYAVKSHVDALTSAITSVGCN